jgi:methylaspartate ammonia-lyase
MRIVDVVTAAGDAGFFFDDQRAIKAGAQHDGFTYTGEPVTEGFTSVRQPAEAVSIMLVLEDGQVAHGDCVAVQYSGAGGRDPLFLAAHYMPIIESYVSPVLVGCRLDSFRKLAERIDSIKVDGTKLHPAIRYGVTQALLDAVAKAQALTMAEVVREEYSTGVKFRRIPIFTQSGDNRYLQADKMILRGAEVLPHGLINSVPEKLGGNGEKFREYVSWLKNRVLDLRTDDEYVPVFHFDVYGTIGTAFDNDTERMARYLAELESEAKPFMLRIEGPMDLEDREAQWKALKQLRRSLRSRNSAVELVADEWCNTLDDIRLFVDEQAVDMVQVKAPDLGGLNNTVEALLYCKQNGVGAYCGGSCTETERSAQVSTHVALACGADQCLAKPGMGVDEGYSIVSNELNRVLALVRARAEQ